VIVIKYNGTYSRAFKDWHNYKERKTSLLHSLTLLFQLPPITILRDTYYTLYFINLLLLFFLLINIEKYIHKEH